MESNEHKNLKRVYFFFSKNVAFEKGKKLFALETHIYKFPFGKIRI